MLNNSSITTLLDKQNKFLIYAFEGQKLIADVAIIHAMPSQSFNYLRDLILSFQPIISFLKQNESLGLYVDSVSPKFQYKIETNHIGHTRTLLLPLDLDIIPESVTGLARLSKTLESGKQYNSVVELDNLSLKDITRSILKNSYQSDADIILSSKYDISLLIAKLPDSRINLENYIDKEQEHFESIIYALGNNELENYLLANTLEKLDAREVIYHCSCTRARTLNAIKSISANENVFEENISLEIVCDYCKKKYTIYKNEI